jgi:NADPH-dependent 2,4-dienoyl-CoA reductase/sulfur reductase-like enzyme
MTQAETTDVLIVGAGPAGLAAAVALRKLGAGKVTVVDREATPGGIPRLCGHTGFGLRDLRGLYDGPSYARHYVRRAERAGVELRPATTITGWEAPTRLTYTSPQGLGQIEARAVVLATGCRERPRSARLVPGNRPQGVFTTGSLQRLVYEQHLPVGRRAVVVGAEIVSLSAVMTLGHAHVPIARMVTEHRAHQIYLPYLPMKWYLMDLLTRTPLSTRARVSEVCGQRRVEGVSVTHLDSGRVEQIACDTVIFTGDWIPEHELARLGGLAMDPATRGPQADGSYRTSAPGVFAVGNLLRGSETADASALEGARAAGGIAAFLEDGAWSERRLRVEAARPLEWVFPNSIGGPNDRTPFGRFTFRVQTFCDAARLTVSQGARRLHTQVYGRLGPNTSHGLRGEWLAQVDPEGGVIRVDLATS